MSEALSVRRREPQAHVLRAPIAKRVMRADGRARAGRKLGMPFAMHGCGHSPELGAQRAEEKTAIEEVVSEMAERKWVWAVIVEGNEALSVLTAVDLLEALAGMVAAVD